MMVANADGEEGEWCGGGERYPTAEDFRKAVADYLGYDASEIPEPKRNWLRWDVSNRDYDDKGCYTYTDKPGRGCSPVWVIDSSELQARHEMHMRSEDR